MPLAKIGKLREKRFHKVDDNDEDGNDSTSSLNL